MFLFMFSIDCYLLYYLCVQSYLNLEVDYNSTSNQLFFQYGGIVLLALSVLH